MRVAIGAPGNGAVLKDQLKAHLEADPRVSDVIDLSTAEITYPQVSFQAARAVLDGAANRAILVCGTGVGTAIAASTVKGARAATAHDRVTVRGSERDRPGGGESAGRRVAGPASRSGEQLRAPAHRDR